MAIEPRVMQFWSEIILVISNRTLAARSFDFEITRMISDQIALHSVQLPLLISRRNVPGNAHGNGISTHSPVQEKKIMINTETGVQYAVSRMDSDKLIF